MSEFKENPASAGLPIPKGFQPMTAGVRRLEVPERDGYHRHWFRGDGGRIAQAKRAGYEFVDPSAVDVNNFDLAGDAKDSGSSDLGSRVSVISGDDIDATGQPGRLYLMECPNHLYEIGQKILADRNDSVIEALGAGTIAAGENGETKKDQATRYTHSNIQQLFNPNDKKRRR